MTTLSHEPSGVVQEPRGWSARLFVKEMWASIAIVAMWIAVAASAAWGGDLVTFSSGGSDQATIPSGDRRRRCSRLLGDVGGREVRLRHSASTTEADDRAPERTGAAATAAAPPSARSASGSCSASASSPQQHRPRSPGSRRGS